MKMIQVLENMSGTNLILRCIRSGEDKSMSWELGLSGSKEAFFTSSSPKDLALFIRGYKAGKNPELLG